MGCGASAENRALEETILRNRTAPVGLKTIGLKTAGLAALGAANLETDRAKRQHDALAACGLQVVNRGDNIEDLTLRIVDGAAAAAAAEKRKSIHLMRVGENPWACTTCFQQNKRTADKCSVCGRARPAEEGERAVTVVGSEPMPESEPEPVRSAPLLSDS
jgi:hypothetical protein